MNHDDEDAIFLPALAATQPDLEVPPGFAEGVIAERRARARAQSRRVVLSSLAAACALALVLALSAWGDAHRRVEGVLRGSDRVEEVRLGDGIVAVLSPGTSGSFAVGGLSGERDVLRLDHGSAFLRVEPGAELSVVTAEGEAYAAGACLEVTRMEEAMQWSARGRWFGGGAVATGMLVAVYQGSAHVSRGQADEGVTLHAAERAMLNPRGELHRADSEAPASTVASSTPQPNMPQQLSGAEEGLADAHAESARLRAILERHAISPETGELYPDVQHGLADARDTDLTPHTWSILANRGELRFRLPSDEGGRITPHGRGITGLSEEEAERAGEVIRVAYRGLAQRVGAIYTRALGHPPAGISVALMMEDVEKRSAEEEVAYVRWMLAQERAGRETERSESASDYESMMRELVAFEEALTAQLAQHLGPERAHVLVHENVGQPFGMIGHPRGQ